MAQNRSRGDLGEFTVGLLKTGAVILGIAAVLMLAIPFGDKWQVIPLVLLEGVGGIVVIWIMGVTVHLLSKLFRRR